MSAPPRPSLVYRPFGSSPALFCTAILPVAYADSCHLCYLFSVIVYRDKKEVGRALRMCGICTTDEEVRATVQEMDEGGDGTIQWTEFLSFMATQLTSKRNMNPELEMGFEGEPPPDLRQVPSTAEGTQSAHRSLYPIPFSPQRLFARHDSSRTPRCARSTPRSMRHRACAGDEEQASPTHADRAAR